MLGTARTPTRRAPSCSGLQRPLLALGAGQEVGNARAQVEIEELPAARSSVPVSALNLSCTILGAGEQAARPGASEGLCRRAACA